MIPFSNFLISYVENYMSCQNTIIKLFSELWIIINFHYGLNRGSIIQVLLRKLFIIRKYRNLRDQLRNNSSKNPKTLANPLPLPLPRRLLPVVLKPHTQRLRSGRKEKRIMGTEALDRLRTTDPAEYLAPSSDLSAVARAASSHLYSSLLPFCPSKPPLDQLLSDESFDAEQIWSQIELLSKPLLPFIRRSISRLEKESNSRSNLAGPALKSNGNAKCMVYS